MKSSTVPWFRLFANSMFNIYQEFLNMCLHIYFDSDKDHDGNEKVLFQSMLTDDHFLPGPLSKVLPNNRQTANKIQTFLKPSPLKRMRGWITIAPRYNI